MRVFYVVKASTRKISLREECELTRLRSEGGSGKLNLLENCKLVNLYCARVLERDEML